MRLTAALALALLGCSGDPNPDGNTDTDTAVPAPEFNFKDVVPATAFEANISQNVIEAHQLTNMMLASVGVVSSDIEVQGIYNSTGGGSYRGALQCWDRPQFPRWSFDMNFANCENWEMGGAVNVNNHPSGVLMFSYSSFQSLGRTMGGSIAFDRNEANPEPLFWRIYNTAQESPGPNNMVPLGIGLGPGTVPKGLGYDGGINVSLRNQNVSVWGEATISGDPPITVVHGAEQPGDVAPDDPPEADAVTLPLDWTQCRCPTSGISSLDMPLEVKKVSLDIDDMDMGDDGFDDAVLNVVVDHTINGRAVLTHVGCGDYEVSYTPATDDSTLEVTGEALFAQASFLCETRTIEDEDRCDALFRAITQAGDSLTVEFTQEQLDVLATEAVDLDFDGTECEVYGENTKKKKLAP